VSIAHIQARETKDEISNTNYVKILPQFTESSAKRYLKNASYVWYVTPKTVTENGQQTIKRVTIIGGHPIIPTKSRIPNVNIDGMEITDFTYDKLQSLILNGTKNEETTTQAVTTQAVTTPIVQEVTETVPAKAGRKKIVAATIEEPKIPEVEQMNEEKTEETPFTPVSNDSLFAN
jgi:hypothetical protein